MKFDVARSSSCVLLFIRGRNNNGGMKAHMNEFSDATHLLNMAEKKVYRVSQ
jgi:hypothetical protein